MLYSTDYTVKRQYPYNKVSIEKTNVFMYDDILSILVLWFKLYDWWHSVLHVRPNRLKKNSVFMKEFYEKA